MQPILVVLFCLTGTVLSRYHPDSSQSSLAQSFQEKTRFDRSVDVSVTDEDVPEKRYSFLDRETQFVAYKDRKENNCYLENTRNNHRVNSESLIKQQPKVLFVPLQSLTKIEAWRLAGGRIVDFCKGRTMILLQDTKPVPGDSIDPFYNELPIDENDIVTKRVIDVVITPLITRTKRNVMLEEREKLNQQHALGRSRRQAPQLRGRFRGQTQSQYLSTDGNNEKEGKAEAEATQQSSRAVVSGSRGMGQAQSMSLGGTGCEDCPGYTGYYRGEGVPDRLQVPESIREDRRYTQIPGTSGTGVHDRMHPTGRVYYPGMTETGTSMMGEGGKAMERINQGGVSQGVDRQGNMNLQGGTHRGPGGVITPGAVPSQPGLISNGLMYPGSAVTSTGGHSEGHQPGTSSVPLMPDRGTVRYPSALQPGSGYPGTVYPGHQPGQGVVYPGTMITGKVQEGATYPVSGVGTSQTGIPTGIAGTGYATREQAEGGTQGSLAPGGNIIYPGGVMPGSGIYPGAGTQTTYPGGTTSGAASYPGGVIPGATVPGGNVPGGGMPGGVMPGTTGPGGAMPGTGGPGGIMRGTGGPGGVMPGTGGPGGVMPGTGGPGGVIPGTGGPGGLMPGTTGPGGLMPGTTGPGGVMPGTTGPGGVMPGTGGPGGAMPGTGGPGGLMPGTTGPGGLMPGTTGPGGVMPGTTGPGGGIPGGMMPGTTIPGGAMPGSTVPGGQRHSGAVPGGIVHGNVIPGGVSDRMVPGGFVPGGVVPGASYPSMTYPGSVQSGQTTTGTGGERSYGGRIDGKMPSYGEGGLVTGGLGIPSGSVYPGSSRTVPMGESGADITTGGAYPSGTTYPGMQPSGRVPGSSVSTSGGQPSVGPTYSGGESSGSRTVGDSVYSTGTQGTQNLPSGLYQTGVQPGTVTTGTGQYSPQIIPGTWSMQQPGTVGTYPGSGYVNRQDGSGAGTLLRYPGGQMQNGGQFSYPGTIMQTPTTTQDRQSGTGQTNLVYPGKVDGPQGTYPVSGSVQGTYPGQTQLYPGTDGRFPGGTGVGYIPGYTTSVRQYPTDQSGTGMPQYQTPGQTSGVGVQQVSQYPSATGIMPPQGGSAGQFPAGQYPGGIGIPGRTGEVSQYYRQPDQSGTAPALQKEDDSADSQASSSVKQVDAGTQASASAQGKYGQGTAQSQVMGTYSGSGSFSAQAGTSDVNKSAQTEISGGKEGATSNAQGLGGYGKSQAQVQLDSESGATSTGAQSSGWNHGTNSQVQASSKGGMADAQANGEGSTSSQAQIGFQPYLKTDEKVERHSKPFRGGGTASAQSGTYRGQSQSQLEGSFQYGITYTGAAQAGSGSGAAASRKPFNFNITDTELFKPFKPYNPPTISKDTETETAVGKNDDDRHNQDDLQASSSSHNIATGNETQDNRQDPNQKKIKPDRSHVDDTVYDTNGDYDEEYDDEYYDSSAVQAAPNSKIVPANSREQQSAKDQQQSQMIHVNTGKRYTVRVKQDSDNSRNGDLLQPGQSLAGYTVPPGFRGRVTSTSGTETLAHGDGKSQAQTVSLVPSSLDDTHENRSPISETRSLHTSRERHASRKGHPSHNQLSDTDHSKSTDVAIKPSYYTVTNSIAGKLDGRSASRKYEHRYYTKSSTCGYFTFSCNIVHGSNGRTKICKPKIPTYPDGTPIKC